MMPKLRIHARVALAVGLAILSILLAGMPAQAGDALKRGTAALEHNDLVGALPLLQRAVVEEPTNEDAHVAFSLALIRAHRYEDAATQIAETRRISPENADVPYLEGRLQDIQEKYPEAEKSYRAAIARKSKHADATFFLGMVLRKEGRPAEALAELNRGLDFARESDVPRFLSGIGLALMDQDSMSAAADSASRAVALDPENPRTHLALGEIYLKRQVWALAKTSLRTATQLDSLNPDTYYKLGLAYYYNGEYTDALQSFKTAVVLDSLMPEPQYWVGHLYVLAGPADRTRYADAVPYLTRFTQWRPTDGRGWLYLGEALYRQVGGDSTQAREAAAALGNAIKYLPRDSQKSRSRAYLLQVKNFAYKLQDLDASFEAFEQLKASGGTLGPDDILLVGSLYEAKSNFAVADSLFSAAVMSDSTKPDPWFKLAESKFQQRDYAAAIPYLQMRIAVDSAGVAGVLGVKPFLPYYMLGQAYNQLGSQYLASSLQDSARAMFDSAVAPLKFGAFMPEVDGANLAKFHLELGTAYAKGDSANRNLAPAEFQAAWSADSTSREAASALYNLAYLDYGAQRYGDAAEKLERAAIIVPQRYDILFLLTYSYVGGKQYEKAKASATRALGVNAGDTKMQQLLQNLQKATSKPAPSQAAPSGASGGGKSPGGSAGKPAMIGEVSTVADKSENSSTKPQNPGTKSGGK